MQAKKERRVKEGRPKLVIQPDPVPEQVDRPEPVRRVYLPTVPMYRGKDDFFGELEEVSKLPPLIIPLAKAPPWSSRRTRVLHHSQCHFIGRR